MLEARRKTANSFAVRYLVFTDATFGNNPPPAGRKTGNCNNHTKTTQATVVFKYIKYTVYHVNLTGRGRMPKKKYIAQKMGSVRTGSGLSNLLLNNPVSLARTQKHADAHIKITAQKTVTITTSFLYIYLLYVCLEKSNQLSRRRATQKKKYKTYSFLPARRRWISLCRLPKQAPPIVRDRPPSPTPPSLPQAPPRSAPR